MKIKSFNVTLRSALLAGCLGLGSSSLFGIDNFESLKVLTSELPSYPTSLTSEGVFDGAARVVLNVNENGDLIDVYL